MTRKSVVVGVLTPSKKVPNNINIDSTKIDIPKNKDERKRKRQEEGAEEHTPKVMIVETQGRQRRAATKKIDYSYSHLFQIPGRQKK